MHIFEINSLTNYQTILLLLVISRAVTQELLKRKIICILLDIKHLECKNASSIKVSKYGMISPPKYKIRTQKILKEK